MPCPVFTPQKSWPKMMLLLCAYFLSALPTIHAVQRSIAKGFGKRICALSRRSPALFTSVSLPPRNVAENGSRI
jgi:hypothetical protein